VASWSDRPAAEVLARWQELTGAITDHLAGLDRAAGRQPFHFHYLDAPLSTILITRVFEIWTHEEDIRRATGRPLNDLDSDRLSLMSSQLMAILPAGMGLAGTARPGRSARVRLTGAGAAEFVVALAPDEEAGEPDVTITTEAVELCRLAADRVGIGELVVDVEGDITLLEPVLVGASAFALD
jgi:uncharacterized protein (TIGR03083 family)